MQLLRDGLGATLDEEVATVFSDKFNSATGQSLAASGIASFPSRTLCAMATSPPMMVAKLLVVRALASTGDLLRTSKPQHVAQKVWPGQPKWEFAFSFFPKFLSPLGILADRDPRFLWVASDKKA